MSRGLRAESLQRAFTSSLLEVLVRFRRVIGETGILNSHHRKTEQSELVQELMAFVARGVAHKKATKTASHFTNLALNRNKSIEPTDTDDIATNQPQTGRC